jgi:NADH:flavin oxidoreductase / NADH oxidase family
LSIPVIAVGRLGEPAIAQAARADAACDFIALGRPLLADPDWSRKVRAGVPVRACRRCRPRRPRRGAPGQHQTYGLDAVGRSAIVRPSQALCPEGSLVLAAQ